jgi:hypothetical protein
MAAVLPTKVDPAVEPFIVAATGTRSTEMYTLVTALYRLMFTATEPPAYDGT